MLAALVGLLLVLTGCTVGPSDRPALATSGPGPAPTTSATPTTSMPIGPGGPGRSSAPAAWESCTDDIPATDPVSGRSFRVDCADIAVPRAYSGSSLGRYSVRIARARTAATPADAPALVTVLGRPGEYGADRVAEVAGSLPTGITDHFAVIGVDLRGTGVSSPLNCVDNATADDLLSLGPDPTEPAAQELLANVARELTFGCGDEAGTNLPSYASTPAADDLDTIRAALGAQNISYLGRGFGATLGATYAERYPGRVASMVLDGPTDPLLEPAQRAVAVAVAAERALDSFASSCPGFTGGCPLGADPRKAVEATISKLGDIGISDSEGRLISGGTVLLALLTTLGDTAAWPKLAAAIAAAGNGDADQLGTLVADRVGAEPPRILLSATVAYACNDNAQRLTGQPLRDAITEGGQKAPLFGAFAVSLVGLCGGWPAPDAALGALSATGAPPILVLGAVDDPTAPYSTVQSLAGHLSSAVLLSWQSGTHGSYPTSSCVTGQVDAYLLEHRVPAPGTLCPP